MNKQIKINSTNNTNNKDEEWGKCLAKINQIFEKDLKHQSSKVCWNACVALRNIFKSQNEEIKRSMLSHSPIMEGLLQILRDRSNFKTQIHCINVLLLLRKSDFLTDFYY